MNAVTAGRVDSAPATRDRFVDLVRGASLLVVVAGHWTMANVVVGAEGAIRGVNALDLMPWLHPVTWIVQVMPLFFVAGGFANARTWDATVGAGTGYPAYLRRRLGRLLRPAMVFGAVILACLGVARLVGVDAGVVAMIGTVVLMPLWFLGVYVGLTAVAPLALAAHRAHPVATLAGLASGAVAIDLIRMSGHAEVGYANFALVWLFAQQLGFWYADGTLSRIRRSWLALAAAVAVGALVLLTGPGPYSVSMVGLPGEMSNMNPPTICLLIVGVGQLALILLARPRLEAWLDRPRPWAWVSTIAAAGMTVYLWHLVVAVAAFGLGLALGLPFPEPATASWWLTRPVWLSALAAGLALVVVATRSVGRVGVDVRARRRVS